MSILSASTQPAVPAGIPCWIEVSATDEVAARRFYQELFGWSYRINRDPATANGRYSIAFIGDLPVGGLYQSAPQQAVGWTMHLAVNNTTHTATWINRLGGRVSLGPKAIPHRGSILHAEDPTGTPIVFWQPAHDWDFGTDLANTFTGADLNTHDGATADYFFGKLFNYQTVQLGDVHTVDYAEWRLGHHTVLYRYQMGSEYPADTPPHWLIYFKIDPGRGTDATVQRATELGGSIVVEPYDTPWGRIALLGDPSGAVFAVIDHSQVVDGWGYSLIDEDPEDY